MLEAGGRQGHPALGFHWGGARMTIADSALTFKPLRGDRPGLKKSNQEESALLEFQLESSHRAVG